VHAREGVGRDPGGAAIVIPVMLITGASRGIGAATARAAVGIGWDVALNYRSEQERAEQLATSLAVESGRRVVAVPGDVSREGDVVAMFDAVESALGGVQCLVNNAGVAPGYGPFADLELADIENVWAVNLTGAFLCAREAVRRMSRSRGGQGGSIVNVSSKAAVIGGPGEWIHYAASKGGLETLTAGLSKEVAREGIRVNNVRPGLIAGDFGPWGPTGRADRMREAVPMGRAGEPDEIAKAIVWLAGDEASYVTGATIDVTGGR
jgi:NAD(P)-dependent dehydrogenase (short-subunit alcohol dehydrogenase family)